MNEILFAILVVFILLLILIFLFSLTVKRVNILVKKIFVDKLQEYDFLIDEKEKKVEELNSNIEIKRHETKKLNEEIESLEKKQEKFNLEEKEVSIPNSIDFENGNLLREYKIIKESFSFNYEMKIKEFFMNHFKEENNEYEKLVNIRSYFTHKTIYKILTYSLNEQKIIINGLLNEEEKLIIKDILNKSKFNVIKFVNLLDQEIKEKDPIIYIYVSNKNLNFNQIHKNIKTLYDDRLAEGFRIEYKGKIYDYSI